MHIGPYSFEAYCEKALEFHGYMAPGVIAGGFLVSLARQCLPPGAIYDVICETRKCLPDAVQLLTPCTIGNGWVKILDVGRFAVVCYDKSSGEGVRVWVDLEKLAHWPVIHAWFLKLTPKHLQDTTALLHDIQKAGTEILSHAAVKVSPEFLQQQQQHKHNGIAVCPVCHEAYPATDGAYCKVCQGFTLPYTMLA